MFRDIPLPSVLFHAVRASMLALPAALIWAAATGRVGREALAGRFPQIVDPAALGDGQVIAAAAVGAIPWLIVMMILWQTQALLDLYRSGCALTAGAARRIHAIGLGLVTLAAAGFVVQTVQVLIVTAANPPGERMLAFAVGSAEVGFLLAGGLMVTIGRSMAEAVRAAEDLRGFV